MKILLIHKFLYPKGGAETYVLKLGESLTAQGHQVAFFGLENEKNTVGNRLGILVPDLDFSAGIPKNLHAPFRILYNGPARRKLRQVLEDFQPDIIHLNNIQFHLTPSVILEAGKYRSQCKRSIKIVCTAHDYQLVCPSHGLFDGRGCLCDRCLGGNYLHCLWHKCVKNSSLKSLLAAADGFLWSILDAYDQIDTIICPSHFLKNTLDTQPRFRDKTVVIHNFTEKYPLKHWDKEGYVLEFGHLSRDKGTYTLLRAAEQLPEIPFVFAGFGEAAATISELPNCKYVGFQTGDSLSELISKAAITVCPSEVYENCPYAVIESQMLGTPVIGARIGGIPELIRESETGELFEAGNADALAVTLQKLLSAPELLTRYSENCRKATFETPVTYCRKLLAIYGGNHENL